MIFLVVDETSGVYLEAVANNGSVATGRLHYVFRDKRFIDEFLDTDLDYLILFCPYNYFDTIDSHKVLPHLIIFDIKNMKNNKDITLLDYDESRMISNEK